MSQARILCVEDDSKTAELVQEFLEREGFQVALANDGEQAIARVREDNFDCVLLDITLPRLDGLTVCRSIRPAFQGGIIMLTARGDEGDQVIGLDSGADDYIPKPIRPTLLLARIKALVRRLSGQVSHGQVAELVVDHLRIVPHQRRVTLKDVVIDVTSTEFELLVALAEQAGMTVSRAQLHQKVRGVRYDGLDRSIDLMIGRLRKKLGDSGRDAKLIKSVHGTGYQLVKK